MAVNDRREIFGWAMYDWANSGFQTTVITVMSGPYLTALARSDVGENGIIFDARPFLVTAKSFFPFCIGLSVFLQVFLLPVLGAVADYTNLKKRLMAFFCYAGSAATCLLFFVTANRYLLGGLLLIVANLCFGASIVLYNAFLNDIASADQRDRVSSRGFALRYFGGGLLLLANLALVQSAPALGISQGLAVRFSLCSAGVWWGGFSIITFRRLRTRRAVAAPPAGGSVLAAGFNQLRASFRALGRLPQTRRYLLAYMLFNDGIQTVIAMASLFLSQELFVARGLPEDQSFLIGLILMIQFVAFFGAHLFERIAAFTGAKRAILFSLVIWTAVIVYAYRLAADDAAGVGYGSRHRDSAGWVAGVVALAVLADDSCRPRSVFFRGVQISERGTSWIGPVLFGMVAAATNSYRQAILSLIVLFLAGMIGLLFTDTDHAVVDARM